MKGFVPLAEYDRVCRERDDLAAEVAYLKGERRDGDDEALEATLRVALRLSPGEARLVAVIWSGRGHYASRDAIAERAEMCGQTASRDTMNVLVTRIRGKIGRDAVQNVWGSGFKLSPGGIATVRLALATLYEEAA